MAPNEQHRTPTTALLSATDAGATELAGDRSILQFQIDQLVRAGICRFLVEVDNVAGWVLGLADSYRARGLSIEFVRSGADLQQFIQSGDLLLVQSEGLFAAPDLLDEILTQPNTFIATLDGRVENDRFERIDLNTRWAGIATVDQATISALVELPVGWNVASSLLRQALQHKVPFFPLSQQPVQDGKLRLIRTKAEMRELDRQILLDRVRRVDGLVEAKLFAPLSARLVGIFPRAVSAARLIDFSAILLGILAAALGAYGWSVAAIISGFLAISLSVHTEIADWQTDDHTVSRLLKSMLMPSLALAVFLTAGADMNNSVDGMFAAAVVCGLAMLGDKSHWPSWAVPLIRSPAIIAILVLIVTPIGGFTSAMQLVALAQLGVMIVARLGSHSSEKKRHQP